MSYAVRHLPKQLRDIDATLTRLDRIKHEVNDIIGNTRSSNLNIKELYRDL